MWPAVETWLNARQRDLSAIIVEPILQGAADIKIYSQDFLRRLCHWTQAHGIHLIADEIMTGIGRTGKMLACQHANIVPDFICLAKGLTAGWLPLSAMLTTDAIYDLFYDDYATGKAFLHSHTHTGNALAASIALEVLSIMESDAICQQAKQLGDNMLTAMHTIAEKTGQLVNVRGIGAVVAADLRCDEAGRRLGYEVYQQAVELGALLRPLGNTLYWFPPLTMGQGTLSELAQVTERAILRVCCGVGV